MSVFINGVEQPAPGVAVMIAAHADLLVAHGSIGYVVGDTDLANHALNHNAHIRNIFKLLRRGQYFTPFPVTGTSTTSTLTADRLYAFPFPIARDVTIDRLAVQVTTADPGSLIRLGIFQLGSNQYPLTLLLDAGEVSGGTEGVKEIVIDQALTRGLYFLAITSDGVPTVRRIYQSLALLGIDPTDFGKVYIYWYKTRTYATLPSSFPGGGALGKVAGASYQEVFARLETED